MFQILMQYIQLILIRKYNKNTNSRRYNDLILQETSSYEKVYITWNMKQGTKLEH